MPVSPDADGVLTVLAFIVSLISATGSLFILGNWICLRSARLPFMRLVVAMALANLLSAGSYIFGFFDWHDRTASGAPSAACLAQAVTMITFEDASILWTVSIAVTLHKQVVSRTGSASSGALEPWFHAICWGVPALTALALLASSSLGPADGDHTAWCWIASSSNHTSSSTVDERARSLQLVTFYLPLVFAFAFNLVCYVRVGRAFGRMAADGEVPADKEAQVQMRLRMYLAAFIAVWTLPLAHRALQLFGFDPPWLRVAHAATQCSMGALNCLAYGCNDATLRPYKMTLARLREACDRGIQLGRRRASFGTALLSADAAIAPAGEVADGHGAGVGVGAGAGRSLA